MEQYLTIEELASAINLPKKHIENYIKVGEEMQLVKVGRKKVISTKEFEDWKNNRDFRIIELDRTDYDACLDFAIRSFYSYGSTSDFGTATQRDAGKFISNFVIGKLGEIAVKKFLIKKFNIEIKLDFDIRGTVVGQDITELARPRKGGRVFNPLRKRVAIKTSKMRNVWLIVPENEVVDHERTSDIYILARVELVLDHLIRALKDHKSLKNLKNIIPDFENIQADVCGFISKNSLSKNSPVKVLPIQKLEIGLSFVMQSGKLNNSPNDWINMLDTL